MVVWIECFDPRNEGIYYYCHETKEVIYEAPDDFINAKDDLIMKSAIKIQCLGRKRMAKHKVQKARFKIYKNAAFVPAFCIGPAEILAGGMAIRRQKGDDPLLALVGSKAMSFGKHYFIFQIGQQQSDDTSDKACEIGMCPYMVPSELQKKVAATTHTLRNVPGSWSFSSKGEIYHNGQKLNDMAWMEPFKQGDVIGLALDYDEHKIAVSRNAMYLGAIPITGIQRSDLVPALSLCSDGDDVSFQWCQKPPYEQFNTSDLASISSSESVEAVLKKYRIRGDKDGPLAAMSSSIASFAPSEMDAQSVVTIAASPRQKTADEEMVDEARIAIGAIMAEKRKQDKQVLAVQSSAAHYRSLAEAEIKKRESIEKNARLEQKQALHRIPKLRERKVAEKRRRKKYMAIQMQRYSAAHKAFLEKQEKKANEQASLLAKQLVQTKEAAQRKKEAEEKKAALAAPTIQNMFEACRYGVPVWRLQELVSKEVQLMEGKSSQTRSMEVGAEKSHLAIFERFCQSVDSGYVMESSHPYSSLDEIDQCMEVAMDNPGVAAGDSKDGKWGICIVFDPRSDTRAGDGHISFLVEDQQNNNESIIHDIKTVSMLFRPQGIDFHLKHHQHRGKEQDAATANSPRPEGVWPDEEVNLPGVNGCPPLFLPTNRFIIRFKAAPWGPSEADQGWGWRLVAFPAQSQQHAQTLLLKSINRTNVHRVLNKRDKTGDTLLHVAAWENNLNAINYLVKEGADVRAIDSIRTRVTPLHVAAMAGHLPAVKALLAAGGDVTSKTTNGDLPLHYACRNGHIAVARRLVKAERKEPQVTVKTRNLHGHLPYQTVPRQQGRLGLLFNVMKDHAEGKARIVYRKHSNNHHKKIIAHKPTKKVVEGWRI